MGDFLFEERVKIKKCICICPIKGRRPNILQKSTVKCLHVFSSLQLKDSMSSIFAIQSHFHETLLWNNVLIKTPPVFILERAVEKIFNYTVMQCLLEFGDSVKL